MDLPAVLGDAAPHLSVTRDEGVVTVAFTRPDKHNAISFAMWHALGRLMPARSCKPGASPPSQGAPRGGASPRLENPRRTRLSH